jgi:glycosyltransferase involved in cell wall biosynthesis
MYNGIDTQEFDREKKPMNQPIADRKKKRLLCIGGIWPHKEPHVLLDAFKIVAARYPQVRLDIVGLPLGRVFRFERPNAASERRPVLCQKPGRIAEKKAGVWTRKVTFAGFVSRPELIDRVPTHLERSVWLHPVEAMAAGTPVVATPSGGIVETMRDHETGFLVEKNDSHALAEAILKLVENDALGGEYGKSSQKAGT